MSRWKEKFKNHPIHITLKEIDNFLNVKTDDTSIEKKLEKRRISKLVNIFKDAFRNLDPELIPYRLLDEVHSAADNVMRRLFRYNETGHYDYLRSANDSLDDILIHLSQLLSITKRSESVRHVKELEKRLDRSTEFIHDKTLALEKEILKASELSKYIDTKKQETDSFISEWQKQYFNDQQKRNTIFANDQQKRNTIFADDQQKRMDIFTNWKNDFEKERKTQLDQLIEAGNQELTTEQKKFSDTISSLITDAENKHKQILELYGLVTGESVAAGHSENAESEKRQADLWRWGTIIFIALTAFWLGVSYIINYINFSWEQIIAAIPLTGIFLFGAAYSSRQSSLHRQNEKRVRWFSLEIKAIDPFIESLSEEERGKLKSEISTRLFGQQYNNTEKGTSIMDGHSLNAIIKAIKGALETKN